MTNIACKKYKKSRTQKQCHLCCQLIDPSVLIAAGDLTLWANTSYSLSGFWARALWVWSSECLKRFKNFRKCAGGFFVSKSRRQTMRGSENEITYHQRAKNNHGVSEAIIFGLLSLLSFFFSCKDTSSHCLYSCFVGSSAAVKGRMSFILSAWGNILSATAGTQQDKKMMCDSGKGQSSYHSPLD